MTIEILTPSGFQKFDGVTRTIKQTLLIRFSSGKYLTCTPDHLVLKNDKWITANSLKPNDILSGRRIVSVKIGDFEYVYDPINVRGDNSYISNGVVSHNCAFAGSSKTLIDGEKLSQLTQILPIFEKDSLKIFTEPVKGNSYVCVVDTSRGQHIDYSAFVVIDITKVPYKVVATYKDNTISPMSYPFLIMQVAQKYNNAYCLIEVNDLGEMVSSTLYYEFEYEQVYFTFKDELNEGMGYPGVRTTKKVKSIGCSTLKDLIESDQLEVTSIDIIKELIVFVQKGASYATEQDASGGGVNDDLSMCLVLFAWLTKQKLFEDLTDVNIRKILAKKTEQHINDNLIPFGFSSEIDGDEATNGFEDMRNSMSNDDAAANKWLFS